MVSKRWIILSVLLLIQPFSAQFPFARQKSASLPDSVARLAIPRTLAVTSNGDDQGTGVVGSSTRAKPNTRHESSFSHCLPLGIKPDDIVSTKVIRSNLPEKVVRTTVEQTLGKLNAVCKKEKLVDGSGKEIYFYHLTGCWGNPPINYAEILQKQRDEIAKLKQKHTVVEMTCNPSGMPIR